MIDRIIELLRQLKDFPEVQIWERSNANPFFGTALLDCGKEIKP